MKQLNMGILSTGNIAGSMAGTIKEMPEVKRCAVASRQVEKADAFAEKYGFTKAYGSYEELAEDPEIDLVYVATPMSEHYSNVMMLLEHGKNVLCEKAFAVTGQEAEKMIQFARKKGLLLAEAMWVRYMPMKKTLQEVLKSEIIGKPQMLTANLGYLVSGVKRLQEPSLGGGALLDLGVYTLNFASIAFGNEISSMNSTVLLWNTGVDAQSSTALCYPDGKMAVLNCTMSGLSDRQGVIYGSKGYILVENINNFEKICVYDRDRQLLAKYFQPKQISGYEYQVLACKEAIERHQVECEDMPHEEILAIMRQMDQIREIWAAGNPQVIVSDGKQ